MGKYGEGEMTISMLLVIPLAVMVILGVYTAVNEVEERRKENDHSSSFLSESPK